MSRVLISGRRHDLYGVEPTLNRFLAVYIGKHDFTSNINGERHIFIGGGATGVDTQAKEWATSRSFIFINHPAEWDRWIGNSAGHFRNEEMLKFWRPNWLIAFLTPESRGTRNMLQTSERFRTALALNVLLIKYADDAGNKAPIEVQESHFDLPVQKMEWGQFIDAPF